METIINKVAESGIITLDLSGYIPKEESLMEFDLKPFLFREMILREKDYRAALPTYDWNQYIDKHVAVGCSVDAIIPIWAYMLAASYLQPFAASIYYGTKADLQKHLVSQAISTINAEEYRDKRVVIKGCGEKAIPESAYVAATSHLLPVVKSIMYGEPCSTVPIFKRK
jgi:hypothetical protein